MYIDMNVNIKLILQRLYFYLIFVIPYIYVCVRLNDFFPLLLFLFFFLFFYLTITTQVNFQLSRNG